MSSDKKIEVLESQVRNLNRSVDRLEEVVEELQEENQSLRRDVENLRSKYLSEKGFDNLSDAERIIIGSWDSVSTNKSENKVRAVSLLKNYSSIWIQGNVNKNGNRYISLKQVKNYYDLQWRNAQRVFEFATELSNGKVTTVKTGNETMLVEKERIATSTEDLDT